MRLGIPALAAIAIAAPSYALAQDHGPCERTDTREPVVLTVEGGGSLGVYEAGMTYTLVETFKRKRAGSGARALAPHKEYCLTVATGASAGNINAFLASMSWCDAMRDSVPEQSTFWRAWVTTGLTQLLPARGSDREHAREGGLFTRRHFREYIQDSLLARWQRSSWLPNCLVNFGATVTRLVPDTVDGAGTIRARNQRMAFALRVVGRDAQGQPLLRAFVPDPENRSYGRLAMLGPTHASETNRVEWAPAYGLIETSSGYPVAFQPLSIKFCARLGGSDDDRPERRPCLQFDSTVVLDGGVFDNGPIALAYLLFFETHPGEPPPTALYLSPDRRRIWRDAASEARSVRQAGRAKPPPHGLETLTQLAREAIPTARQYELAFAGRILPSAISRQEADELIDALQREKRALARRLTLAEKVRAFEVDSLRAAMALVCRRGSLPTDTVLTVPAGCEKLASFDTTTPRRPAELRNLPTVQIDTTRARLRPGASLDSTFRATTRWHALAGDWLAGFGAFIARPLREYDFYVGMYDAFVLLVENGQCRTQQRAAADNTSRAANERLRSCVRDSLAVYLDNPPIEVGRVGSRVLRELRAYEFGLPTAPAATPPTSADDSTLIVIQAIARAFDASRSLESALRPAGRLTRLKPSPGHCTRRAVFDRFFCESGIVAFVDELQKDRRAVAIMRHWAREAGCDDTRWDRPDDCRVERRFVRMVDDPEGELNRMTGAMVTRLETVTPPKTMARTLASGLVFFHASTTDRFRRGFDLGPTSIPATAGGPWGVLRWVLPSSVMFTPNTAGWGELTWEARRHLGQSPYALTVPVHLRAQSQIGKDSARGPDVSLLAPGVRLEHKDVYMGTRVGLEADFWYRNKGVVPSRYLGHSYGVFVSVLGKLNFSWTTLPADLTYYREKAGMRPFGVPTVMTFGVGDFAGSVYWASRLMR